MIMNEQQKEFQEKLRAIYKTQDTIEPLVEGLNGIPKKKMKDFYIKLHTTIDENDEKNQNNSSNKISSKKQEIELENIFDKISGEEEIKQTSKAANKLLILGGAGVGKSTMMKYITYKWAEGELWNNRFDFVYRVPLKTLASWRSGSNGSHSPLKCLVHYYLESLLHWKERADFKLEGVVWADGEKNRLSERILLLLDGYDEVVNSQDPMVQNLFEEMVEELDNVILTSRPNALNQEMAKKFDRKIENIGLGAAGINQYFSRYFEEDKDKGKGFQKFLAKNPAIREICNIPVNIAMLCFVWSEESKDMEKISSMSELYGKVVHHLGVRYMSKSSQKLQKLEDKGVQIEELKVLQHVAYRSLIGGELEDSNGQRSESSRIIKGEIRGGDEDGTSIQSSILYLAGRKEVSATNVSIEKVYEYGLLKPEGGDSEGDLKDQSFSFLHLSFQEYLTAQYLVGQLRYGCTRDQARIANFIARHRNEPRLALILKFMAGILKANPNQNEEVMRTIRIFWDSILCNPNGVLELGMDAKVNLLMHLLGNGEIDKRVPKQELVVEFIDCRVLENVLWWVDELKDSDYMSPNIKTGLLEILSKGDSSWSVGKSKELFEGLSSKLKRVTLDEKNKEVLIPEGALQPADISIVVLHDKKLIQEEIGGAISSLIFKFTPEEQSQIIQKLLADIKKREEDQQIIRKKIHAMIKIAQTLKLSPQESQAFIEALLENIFYKNLGLAARRAIQEMLKISEEPAKLKGLVKENLRGVKIDSHCKSLQAHLKGIVDLAKAAGSDDLDFMREIVQVIIPLLESSESQGRERAEITLTQLVEECSENISSQVLQDLLNILLSMLSKDKMTVRVSAAKTISSLVNCKAMNRELILNLAQDVIPLLGEPISAKYYRVLDVTEALIQPLFEIDKLKVEEIASLLITKLQTSNETQLAEVSKRLEIIANLYGHVNVPLIRKIIEGLIEELKNEKNQVRQCALEYMTKLLAVVQDRELCHDVRKALVPLLLDEKKEFREKTLDYILKLFQISPSTDIDLFKELMRNLMGSFNDFDPSIRSASSKSLKRLVMESGLPDLNWLKEVFDALVSLTEEESTSVNKREIAFDTILELVRMMKGAPVKELIETFNLKMEKASPELKARMNVMVVRLERIAGNQDIQRVKDAFDGLSDLLENDDDHVRLTAARNMLELLRILVATEDDAQLMKISIARFCVILKAQGENPALQEAIIFYITELFKITGDKYIELIDELTPVLVSHIPKKASDKSNQVYQAALLGVIRLFKASNVIDIGLTQKLIKRLTNNQQLIEAKKFVMSVRDVLRTYKNQDALYLLLIPFVKSKSIGKVVSEEILALVEAKDSQEIQNLLNRELLAEMKSEGNAQIFKLKLDLIIKDGDLKDKEKIESFIATLKPFLQQSEDFKIKQNAFAYLVEAVKLSQYPQDSELVKDLVEAVNFILSTIAKGQQLEPNVPQNILNLLEITENKDKQLLRKTLLFFIENPQAESGDGKRESCCWILRLLKKENDQEFLKGVLEDLIPKLDMTQHAGLLQKLSVFLLPHCDIIAKYLDHPNINLRKNFRAGVMHYLKIYLSRFEVLEELLRESETRELTLKEINERLFVKIVDEDGCCSKRESSLKEIQLNGGDKAALRSLLANEIDRAETRQGIEIVQIAFLSIAKVEYSKNQVEKKLPEVAWGVIRVIHKYLKKEKLTWVRDNYGNLTSSASQNAAAIKAIFGKLYHKILEDGVITDLEEKLITLFIQQGLTTSLTKKGEIVFQDIKYEIKGDNEVYVGEDRQDHY